MPLRNEEKTWIQEQIADAIGDTLDSLKPKGWRRALYVMREIGPLAAIIGLFLALIGITCGALYQSFAHLKEETEFRTRTGDTFSTIDTRLGNIDKSLVEIKASLTRYQLERLADNPADPENATSVEKLVTSAQEQNIRLDAGFIRKVGDRFIRTAKKSDSAWKAFLALLSYHSFVVGIEAPHSDKSVLKMVPDKPYELSLTVDIGPKGEPARVPTARFAGAGLASPENSARLEPIGANQNQGSGLQYLIITDEPGTIRLDDMFIKNVIFENMTFSYHGGPIKMENVYFVNCKFNFANDKRSKDLLLAVLRSGPATTFESAS
jgi:hypothetical protein